MLYFQEQQMCWAKRSAKLTVRGVVAQQRERKGEERDGGEV